MNLAVAATLAGSFAFVGRGLGWLTTAGALAAAVVGAAVFAGAGIAGGALLGTFFISGSILTKLTSRNESQRLNQHIGGRTPRQVLANGGWAAVGAIAASASEIGWPLLAGSLAAAQADTWATEVGAFSAKPPRLITSGRVVTAGTSGGITVLGSLGGALGATVTALAAALLGLTQQVAVAALVGGLCGMTVDSVLGATAQGRYVCETCEETGETRIHLCGRRGRQTAGSAWIDNDAVNLIATGTGAAVATAVWALL